MPAGTVRIKVVNAAEKYSGAWKIDVAGSNPDLKLELPRMWIFLDRPGRSQYGPT
jgi:hypothetical protein